MLKFEKKSQKKWNVQDDQNGSFLELNLASSSVTNKFEIITSFIENVSGVCGNEFDSWFLEFYYNARHNPVIVSDEMLEDIEKLKGFVDHYFDHKQLDFNQFVDYSKVKKGSILFEPDEIEKIIRASGYLKIFCIISNNEDIKIEKKIFKELYNVIVKELVNSEIVYKIFNIVKTRSFRYSLTDKYMWEYIKMVQCKSIDVHVVEIFNFVMNYILILCEEDKNPITYFVGVVEESVKWVLRSVYKKAVIYDDSVSTEDIHGLNVDNLKTYTYNDTLGRLKGVAYEKIYDEIEKSNNILLKDEVDDNNITEFQKRVSDIEYISPLSESLVFPLLSKMSGIPFRHFSTLSPEHSVVLSVYIQRLLKKVFKNEYEDLFSLLTYFPISQPALATTYKIKSVNGKDAFVDVQNSVNNFFGFKTKLLPYKLISYFVGRTSRVNFCDIFTGRHLKGIPLTKIEKDAIKFYTLLFSGKLDDKIDELTKLMNNDM